MDFIYVFVRLEDSGFISRFLRFYFQISQALVVGCLVRPDTPQLLLVSVTMMEASGGNRERCSRNAPARPCTRSCTPASVRTEIIKGENLSLWGEAL